MFYDVYAHYAYNIRIFHCFYEPCPYPLRLFTGCLTVFGRRGVVEGSEGIRSGYGEQLSTQRS